MTTRVLLALTVIAAALGLSASAEAAQAQAADARWAPWLGCWDVVNQAPQPDPRNAGFETAMDAELASALGRGRVCVEPAGPGVTIRTVVEGTPVLDQTLVADGVSRPIDLEGCRGTEREWWSANERRLYSEAELVCAGQARSVSGLSFIASDGRWIDVQSVRVDDVDTVRVRHFEPDAVRAARRSTAAAGLTIADVVDASRSISAATLEAAILESRSTFPLSADTLVNLGDAGVPGSVTDLMVAVTFPDHFSIERTQPDDRLAHLDRYPVVGRLRWSNARWSYYDPFRDRYYNRYYYRPYYDSSYYYSPFGYSYLGRYPVTYILIPNTNSGGGSGLPTDGGPAVQPRPRVINGLGYTRVQPGQATGGNASSDTAPSAPSGARMTRRGATTSSSSGSSGSSGDTNAGSTDSSSSGTPAASEPPTDSGAGSTNRRAVPR